MVFPGLAGIDHEEFYGQAIYYDGMVVAKTSVMTIRVYCQLKFRYFPFDSQVNKITNS